MSEQGVEMRLRTQMENMGIVSVVNMSKDAKQLSIDVLRGGGEILREIVA